MLQADLGLNSTYDLRLVGLSIVIAILASYTALDLAGRVTAAKALSRLTWLIGGAIVMGIGIWSMHFVAMLAFSLPIPMDYDMLIVLVSMLPAIFASGGALFLASRRFLSLGQLLIGGILMGIGIASMHYIGMYAMQMEANTQYDPVLFLLSVAIAIIASIVALWIAFQLRNQTSITAWWSKIGSAVVMGAAIAGMHYTGMAAARFTVTNPAALSSALDGIESSLSWLAVAIGISTFVILGFTLMTSFVDQRLTAQAKLLAQQESETKRSQLFTEITLRIRHSLRLDDVLNTTVNEIRQVLKTDRVIIYHFNNDWSGTVIAESVGADWAKTLGTTINHPMRDDYIEMYKNGHIRIANHITSNSYKVDITDFNSDLFHNFQIKANLVAPILKNNLLIGLLCAHQCSKPRYWQKFEIDLFRQLAIQLGIALEQASLLHELQQAQKVLQLRDRAIAAASNPIFITDSCQSNNPIIFCNPAFEKITGYSEQEILGRDYSFLHGTDTDPATIEQIRNAVNELSESDVVIKNYRKDGTPFWCELTISPVQDIFGQVTNFIGVLADITLRKQMEEELKGSNQTLQNQLLGLLNDIKEASTGDLTVRAEVTTGDIGVVADFLNAIIATLQQIVTQVKNTAQQVKISVGENSSAIEQLGDEALKQAKEISRMLERVDKMIFSIQTVADNVRQAAEVAKNASQQAEAVETVIDRTVKSILNLQQTITQTANKVKGLGETSQNLSLVVSWMHKIAIETNLLSIDASVEAAWVGNEGRSFILLLEQISKLAVQSAEATKEIQQIVENIQLETNDVVQTIELGTNQIAEEATLVQDAKLSLGQILEVSEKIDNLLQLIAKTTVAQTQTSQAVALFMKQIAKSSERTADLSGVVSNSLEKTIDVALQLHSSVDVFKT